MRPVRHNRLAKPLAIIGDDSPRWLPAVNPARAKILWFRPIAVCKPIVDLALITSPPPVAQGAKKDARI
jgi:hypothetical protein